MKKVIKKIIVILIVLLFIQLIYSLFKNKHTVTYNIKIDNNNVKIIEKYYKKEGNNYYLFDVRVGDKRFLFDIDNTFNKQKKIIKDIKIYEQDDLMCISPIYIKNNKEPFITCNIENKQYSYSSIKDSYDLSSFVEQLPNFKEDKYSDIDTLSNINNNKIYKDNLYDNEYILLYEYNHLLKITNKKNEEIKFANYDIYNNDLGVLIDKYYIIPKYENLPLYNALLVIDIVKNKIKEIEIPLATNIYINGIVNNKLYLFDKSNLIQYEINPFKNKYEITGNKNKKAMYYDGKWSNKNVYEMNNNNLVFSNNYPIDEEYIKAFEQDKYYYYINKNNEVYKIYKEVKDYPILLFQLDNINEVEVINNKVYFISNDTLYRYDYYGIKRLVTNSELKYNYKNIYSVYYK